MWYEKFKLRFEVIKIFIFFYELQIFNLYISLKYKVIFFSLTYKIKHYTSENEKFGKRVAKTTFLWIIYL